MQKKSASLYLDSNWGFSSLPQCGPDQPKTQTAVLGHSLFRLLVRSHHSLIRLLRTARSALLTSLARYAALNRLLARSLTSLTPSLMGKWMIRWPFCLCFFPFSSIVIEWGSFFSFCGLEEPPWWLPFCGSCVACVVSFFSFVFFFHRCE